ncbi:MAG: hypothetical protein J6P93_05500 [Alphaproteobacteria bacterium]|nr:hypothetical protein [Alphaproteobacteria bacterium]
MYELISAILFLALFIKIYFFDKKKRMCFFLLTFGVWFIGSFLLNDWDGIGSYLPVNKGELITSEYFIVVIAFNFILMLLIQKGILADEEKNAITENNDKKVKEIKTTGKRLLDRYVTFLMFVSFYIFLYLPSKLVGTALSGKNAENGILESRPLFVGFLLLMDGLLLVNQKFSWPVFIFLLFFSIFFDSVFQANGINFPMGKVCLAITCLLRLIFWLIRKRKEKQ